MTLEGFLILIIFIAMVLFIGYLIFIKKESVKSEIVLKWILLLIACIIIAFYGKFS